MLEAVRKHCPEWDFGEGQAPLGTVQALTVSSSVSLPSSGIIELGVSTKNPMPRRILRKESNECWQISERLFLRNYAGPW
jgi:hypothetical protein